MRALSVLLVLLLLVLPGIVLAQAIDYYNATNERRKFLKEKLRRARKSSPSSLDHGRKIQEIIRNEIAKVKDPNHASYYGDALEYIYDMQLTQEGADKEIDRRVLRPLHANLKQRLGAEVYQQLALPPLDCDNFKVALEEFVKALGWQVGGHYAKSVAVSIAKDQLAAKARGKVLANVTRNLSGQILKGFATFLAEPYVTVPWFVMNVASAIAEHRKDAKEKWLATSGNQIATLLQGLEQAYEMKANQVFKSQ